MGERRILYVLRPKSFPSGGEAAIIRHVEILNANGLSAFVAIHRRPRKDFYHSKAPLLIFGNLLLRSRGAIRRAVRPGDIWVVPEVYHSYLRALAGTPAKRIMLCQGQYALPFTSNPKQGIAEFGADSLLVTTECQLKFFRDVYRAENLPYVQGYAIDPGLFAPAADKKRQIAYMPRKLPADAAFIMATFKRRYPDYSDIPWIAVDGLIQSEVARVLGESAVFLVLSHKDSLGLPPLEAMSCGCYCAGYFGDGGRTYMTAKNGWWANDGDWLACVDGLAAAIAVFDAGGERAAAIRHDMANTVRPYRPERLEAALLDYWRHELANPFP